MCVIMFFRTRSSVVEEPCNIELNETFHFQIIT